MSTKFGPYKYNAPDPKRDRSKDPEEFWLNFLVAIPLGTTFGIIFFLICALTIFRFKNPQLTETELFKCTAEAIFFEDICEPNN